MVGGVTKPKGTGGYVKYDNSESIIEQTAVSHLKTQFLDPVLNKKINVFYFMVETL